MKTEDTYQQAQMFDTDGKYIHRSAELSEDGRYRWWLRRTWNGGDGRVAGFIMLNPSTADALKDDPTIRRCINFAKAWGFTTLSVRNLFALRATDPKELKTAANPTGGSRGDAELIAAGTAHLTIAAWGAGVPFSRDKEVLDKYFSTWPMWCLGVTKHGAPRHPLYVPGNATPVPFRNCEASWIKVNE